MGEQWCCGGPAAEMGYVDQAREFAEHNMASWRATGTKRILVLDPHDYISFTEDYPKYFGADFDLEVVLVVELFAEMIRDGRLVPDVAVDRAITYHDPCRLNKRKGIWAEPREVLRAIPGLRFEDVDRVTQWSYCSGGGGGLRGREARAHGRDQRAPPRTTPDKLDVDTLVSACPWSERPLTEAGDDVDIDVLDIHELLATSLGIEVGGSRGARPATVDSRRSAPARRAAPARGAAAQEQPAAAIRRGLRVWQRVRGSTRMTILIEDARRPSSARCAPCSPTSRSSRARADRFNRARVPAPFPVHRWAERIPDVVVLPTSTEQVAAVVRIANDLRVPVVPRDGGTGLTDGAVPLRGGILVDVKRMNQVHELDLVNRTVTVGTGINMLKLNEYLAPHGLFYPDDPASYPCSLVGGRIGTSGWSLIGARYGHTRDLVLSFDHVLPTGEILHVGDGIGRKVSKSSSGYQLKHLFMGHQGTLGIATRATLKLFPKPEAELSPFWSFDNYDDAYACTGALARAGVATFAGAVLFDEHKVAYLRRDDEAYIPAALRRAGTRMRRDVRLRRRGAGRAEGDCSASPRSTAPAISETRSPQGDWAARHDRYATPLHGRTKDGQVVPMSWHCEDAAINYSNVPSVTKSLARDRRRPEAPHRRLRRLGDVRVHVREAPVSTTSPRSTSGSGSSSSTIARGACGSTRSGRSRACRSTTAARSARATARAATARSTSCPRSSVAAST